MMRAFDTNIVVRLLVRDDPKQLALAERLLEEEFMILPTVVLETAWVLHAKYRLARLDIANRLVQLLSHNNAMLVSGEAIKWALDHYAAGVDFADALHLALAAEAEASSFMTFDKGIKQTRLCSSPIRIERIA